MSQTVHVYVGDEIVRTYRVETDDALEAESAALRRVADLIHSSANQDPATDPDEVLDAEGAPA